MATYDFITYASSLVRPRSVQRSHTGPQKTKLLDPTRHLNPQCRALAVAASTALVNGYSIVIRKEHVPSNAIIAKWCHKVGSIGGVVAAKVVETEASANETRPLRKRHTNWSPKHTPPPHQHPKSLLDVNTQR